MARSLPSKEDARQDDGQIEGDEARIGQGWASREHHEEAGDRHSWGGDDRKARDKGAGGIARQVRADRGAHGHADQGGACAFEVNPGVGVLLGELCLDHGGSFDGEWGDGRRSGLESGFSSTPPLR